MAAPPEKTACAYVVGDDGLSRWTKPTSDAWIGLLETQKRLTRELDVLLDAQHGIGLSELEVLGRLAAAERRSLRVSTLAGATGLSVSRVSRLVDALERRGLVERRSCPDDGRAINAVLTEAGLGLARAAQADHFAAVQERFFDSLSEDEVATLASVFARFSPGAAEACDADADADADPA
jgi:DNA-binding MarR family transcriptional regulator